MSKNGNRSGDPRRRALRLLAREHFADYTSIYEEIRPSTRSRYQARDRARTQLRSRFPARYRPISPATPVASAAQAIIGELGFRNNDGEQRDAAVASLAVGRMLRSAPMSIADPAPGSPARGRRDE